MSEFKYIYSKRWLGDDVRVHHEVDVLVAGGGAAGVAAAVAAARSGARTLLIERQGFLGGTMTAVSLGGICGLYSLVDGEPRQIVFGFAEEVRARLLSLGAIRGPLPWLNTASLPYDLFLTKAMFDDVVSEPRLSTLLRVRLIDARVEDCRLVEVLAIGNGQTLSIRAAAFVDCTGDAELSHLAGAAYDYDPCTSQFPNSMFRMGGVAPQALVGLNRAAIRAYMEMAVADGYDMPRLSGGIYMVRDGIVHLNITKVAYQGRPPDVFDAQELSHAEFEGRRQARRYLQVFKRYVPGFENAFIIDTGAELGVRETRRIKGDYTLSQDDILNEVKFDDAIACNCWPIEDHGSGRDTRWVWLSPGGYNHIPYRSLVPRGLINLLAAGRCISATHDAQAAIRVTANCFSMGQAAGHAAAMASDGDVRAVEVPLLQHKLRAQGAELSPSVLSAAQ